MIKKTFPFFVMFLISLGLISCGDECGDGNEVCGQFECVCIFTPCDIDADCPQGLFCEEGFCSD